MSAPSTRRALSGPRVRTVLALGLATVLAAACGSSTATTAPTGSSAPSAAPTVEPTPAGPLVLKVAATAGITTWDPVKSFSTEALYLANVYEPLLWVNPPSAAEPFTPALATAWEASADGLTWTFTIREGVTFHDGEPLTADAVVQSIQAAKERAGASFIWLPLDTVSATDAMTVTMTLKYAAPMDLVASSLYGAWIVSPKALAAAAADETYFEAGIDAGTGPYTIESYTPDKEVLLTAYEAYWGATDDVDHYDKVLISIAPEAVTQQQMLDGGDVDLALSLPLENIESYRSNPDFTFIEEPSFFNYVGYFNVDNKPLDDVRVRQALSWAIPYDDIVTVGAQGYGTQSRGPVPAGVFPYDASVPQYTQDLDKARQLLTEAGYDGGGFALELTYASENQNETRFAPLIKEAYAAIGVDVTLTPMLFSQQWERAKGDPAGRQDMFLVLYWPTYSDAGADNLWSLFRSSEAPFFNLSYWEDAEYDKLVDDAGALTATQRDAAKAKYVEAMKRLVDQAPGLFFYDTKFVTAIPKRIAGFQYNLNYPFAQFFYPLHPAS
ncbi:MAG: ABC transporter substrate-binding protein [Chloroflexota bacterium]